MELHRGLGDPASLGNSPVRQAGLDPRQDLIADWRARGADTFVIGSDKIIVAHSLGEWVETLSQG